MENIICPNCGAQNSHYGKCEYCGTTIREPKATTTAKQNDAESFAQKIAKYRYVDPFIGGVAVVSDGGYLYGVINEQGDLVVPLSSVHIKNCHGRLLLSSTKEKRDKILDSQGKLLAEADGIKYIEQGNFILQATGGKQYIFNNDNERLTVKLPNGIKIVSSLEYGCYDVSNGKRHGIALRDKLLLPCHYEFPENRGSFRSENRNLMVIEDADITETNLRRGLFNLETGTIILPCQYTFSVDPIRGGGYDDGLLVVYAEKNKGGVFDVKLKEFVLPLTKCYRILTMGKRCYKIIKNGIFGSKEITIQL
jgi:hypothetical protein